MSRKTATAVAFLTLLGSGLVHGVATERWSQSTALDEAVARLDAVPSEFGPWRAQPADADADAFAQAGALGYWVRTYTHRHTKASLLVILMCGRPAKMAIHTPAVCYQGAGYEMRGEPRPLSIADDATFWTARFSKPTGLTTDLRLDWAWAAQGSWEAAEYARWRFRGEPYLYKLYVAHDLTGRGAAADASTTFLRAFVPALRSALFPGAAADRDLDLPHD